VSREGGGGERRNRNIFNANQDNQDNELIEECFFFFGKGEGEEVGRGGREGRRERGMS
jgi:hypothetical protein